MLQTFSVPVLETHSTSCNITIVTIGLNRVLLLVEINAIAEVFKDEEFLQLSTITIELK